MAKLHGNRSARNCMNSLRMSVTNIIKGLNISNRNEYFKGFRFWSTFFRALTRGHTAIFQPNMGNMGK